MGAGMVGKQVLRGRQGRSPKPPVICAARMDADGLIAAGKAGERRLEDAIEVIKVLQRSGVGSKFYAKHLEDYIMLPEKRAGLLAGRYGCSPFGLPCMGRCCAMLGSVVCYGPAAVRPTFRCAFVSGGYGGWGKAGVRAGSLGPQWGWTPV